MHARSRIAWVLLCAGLSLVGCKAKSSAHAINVDCGSTRCAAIVHAADPTLEHNTLTFTGRLTAGPHTIEVVVHNVETSVMITASGGIRPDSLRLQYSSTSAVDVPAPNRCGIVTTFRTRPTSTFESVYGFDVMLATAPTVC